MPDDIFFIKKEESTHSLGAWASHNSKKTLSQCNIGVNFRYRSKYRNKRRRSSSSSSNPSDKEDKEDGAAPIAHTAEPEPLPSNEQAGETAKPESDQANESKDQPLPETTATALPAEEENQTSSGIPVAPPPPSYEPPPPVKRYYGRRRQSDSDSDISLDEG